MTIRIPSQTYDGQLVQRYYIHRLRELATERDARLAQLRTPGDAQWYCNVVRRKIRSCFGVLPNRTALCPVISGVLERSKYRVEKLHFQSRPGYFVTGNLYIPHGKGTFPAVLGTCGHAAIGKAEPTYQRFARSLAEQGYVVLIYDPVSQGERLQYRSIPKRLRPDGCVHEHQLAGHQLSLLGEFFGTWRLWDGVRALDYLLSRPEVDTTRVGVTGNSGGGTLATYLNALDDRFTMAAPSCFVTTYLNNLENELPADSEQVPPRILQEGLDIGDFIIACAPRPTILIGQENDFFDVRGLRKTYEQARRVYALLGAGSNIALHVGPGKHGYQPDARSAMYDFFSRFAKVKCVKRESQRETEKPATLQAAPRGDVSRLPGNKFIYELSGQSARQLRAARGIANDAKVRALLPKLLGLSRSAGNEPGYRVLRPVEQRGAKSFDIVYPFAVTTEPQMESVLFYWARRGARGEPMHRGQPPTSPALTLYVPHLSSENEVPANLPIHAASLWSVDVRGMGRVMPKTCNDTDFFSSYGQDFFYASHGDMLGLSYAGRRVHDLLTVLDLLAARGARRVHLVGRGMGAITATFAACLHPVVTRVTLQHALRSYHELTQNPVYLWPLSSMVHGILRHFDLPDCYRLLKKNKQLKIIDPWNAFMKCD